MTNVSEKQRLAFILEDVNDLISTLKGLDLPEDSAGISAWTYIQNIESAASDDEEIERWVINDPTFINYTPILADNSAATKFAKAFHLLKSIDIDGETAEVLLHELGLGDEVYGRIIVDDRYVTAKKVWDDLHGKYDNFLDYYHAEILNSEDEIG